MDHSWYLIKSNEEDINNSNLPIKVNLNIKIPYIYRQEPVVYNLAYKYNLEVKILAGNLSNSQPTDGLFSLQITGLLPAINDGLKYMSSLNIEFCDFLCNNN